jgi:hypothetical protein
MARALCLSRAVHCHNTTQVTSVLPRLTHRVGVLVATGNAAMDGSMPRLRCATGQAHAQHSKYAHLFSSEEMQTMKVGPDSSRKKNQKKIPPPPSSVPDALCDHKMTESRCGTAVRVSTPGYMVERDVKGAWQRRDSCRGSGANKNERCA